MATCDVGNTSFKLTGSWGKLKHVVDRSRFESALKQNIRQATQRNAMRVVADIRKRITGRAYSPNAALTILIKKSTKPLVDDGDLFQAITHQMLNDKTAFVGALKATQVNGQSAADLAAILHEGATIAVTPAMRGLFFILAEVGAGKKPASELTGRAADLAQRLGSRLKGIKPLRASTTHIVIPPRPFLRESFEDPQILGKLKQEWERAVSSSLTGTAP